MTFGGGGLTQGTVGQNRVTMCEAMRLHIPNALAEALGVIRK